MISTKFGIIQISKTLAFFFLICGSPIRTLATPKDPAIQIADSLYRASHYQKAINVLEKRLLQAKKAQDQHLVGVIHNSLGKALSQLGKPVEALKSYQLARKIAVKLGDKQSLGKILKNIGALYEEQKNFKQALSYYNTAENIALELKDDHLLADCYNNKGVVYEQQLRYPLALENYHKALKIYEKLKLTDRIALTLNNIGIVYKFLGRHQLAINSYNRSLHYSRLLGDRFFEAANLNNIGNVYALMQNYTKAIEFNSKSLEIAKSIKSLNIEVEAYASLAEDYAGLGDFKKAYQIKDKYVAVSNEYFNIERSGQLAEMHTKYDSERRDRQIKLLKQKQQISSLSIATQKLLIQKKNYQIFLIATIMVVLVSGGYVFYYQRSNKLILERERAVADAENNERSRIAKDVHDDIGSGLSKITFMAAGLQTRMAFNGAAVAEIAGISRISTDLVENMRDLIWVLNPENGTLDNMVARIREYCLDYTEGLTINPELDIQDDIPALRISQKAQRNIFLTVKEALHNCIKHADCDKIAICLTVKDGLLSVSIVDSGKGFDSEELKRKGNGLRNMQQRIQSVGGQLQISSSPGKGTTVKTEIKLSSIEKLGSAVTT